MRSLPGSTCDVYERYKLGMHTKQELVESLNYSNDTVFLTQCICLFSTKQVVLFIEAAPVSTPYCLPSLLATSNQISRTGEASHGSHVYGRESRVYEQYTRQNHPMGNTEQILHYYKYKHLSLPLTCLHLAIFRWYKVFCLYNTVFLCY